MTEEELMAALAAAASSAGIGERGGSWDLLYFAPGKMSKKRGKVMRFVCDASRGSSVR